MARNLDSQSRSTREVSVENPVSTGESAGGAAESNARLRNATLREIFFIIESALRYRNAARANPLTELGNQPQAFLARFGITLYIFRAGFKKIENHVFGCDEIGGGVRHLACNVVRNAADAVAVGVQQIAGMHSQAAHAYRNMQRDHVAVAVRRVHAVAESGEAEAA